MHETLNIERRDAPQASNAKVAEPLLRNRSLNWGRQRQVDITHQNQRNIDPPPAKPFRAGSDEVRSTRTRTLYIILLHTQDILPSASIGTDINNTLRVNRLQARLAYCTLSESTPARSGRVAA